MATIFQVITMEGWVEIMYMIDDTNGNFLTIPYFSLIIIIGSFFLLNLILAVIMRVFTQNDELEKLKFQRKKILEDTKKLRNNPKAYLAPLKEIKITRPKSASYRKKYESIEVEKSDREDESFKKRVSKVRQTDSNFIPLHSPNKLKKTANDQQEISKSRKDCTEKHSSENILELFETKKSVSKPEIQARTPGVLSRNFPSMIPEKRSVSEVRAVDIQDKFAMFMTSLRKKPNRHRSSKRNQSHISSQEEKEKLFDKILKLKSSISSESISEFKDEKSGNSVSGEEENKSRESEIMHKNIFLKIILSNYFTFFIMGAILVNTVLLCMERYPMSN